MCVYVPIRLTTPVLTRRGSESCDSEEAAVRSRVAGSTAAWETGSWQRGSIGVIDTSALCCSTSLRCAPIWSHLFFLALLTIHLVAASLEETVASGGEGRRGCIQNNCNF